MFGRFRRRNFEIVGVVQLINYVLVIITHIRGVCVRMKRGHPSYSHCVDELSVKVSPLSLVFVISPLCSFSPGSFSVLRTA